MREETYANAIFDDVQVWEASRDSLIALDHINPGITFTALSVLILFHLDFFV